VRRRYGTARALRLAVGELAFDLLRGTDTSLEAACSGPGKPDAALHHEPCNPVLFAELVGHLPVGLADATLLDYGCGKGRVLLLAVERGCVRAVGVEISDGWCATARRNLAVSRRRRVGAAVEVVCADAAVFEVPDDVDVAFLFNPFGREVVRAAAQRISSSLSRAPRPFHVAYLYPRYADEFVREGFRVAGRYTGDGVVLVRAGG
jgi:SAM-dependent methyltransferase